MTTPTPEAIEAAAEVFAWAMNDTTLLALTPYRQAVCREQATAALSAAAPFIAAQAKAEALAPIIKLHSPFTVHPSGIGTKYCVHCWGSDGSKEWPCATVNVATIEGKSE